MSLVVVGDNSRHGSTGFLDVQRVTDILGDKPRLIVDLDDTDVVGVEVEEGEKVCGLVPPSQGYPLDPQVCPCVKGPMRRGFIQYPP